MNELIKIEIKKTNLPLHLKGVVIANVILFPLLVAMFLTVPNAQAEALGFINTLIKGIFLIWQSILISQLIIDELKTRTLQHLYTYPLKKSVLMSAKVVLISLMMLGFILVTQLIQHSLLSGLSLILPEFSYVMNIESVMVIVLTSIFGVMVGMLPLAVGLWTKSNIAPVITAVLILSVFGATYGEVGTLDLFNNLMVMASIGVIGTFMAVFAIKDLLKKDLIV